MKHLRKTFSIVYGLFAIATLVFIFSIYNTPTKFEPIRHDDNYTFEFIHGEVTQVSPPTNEEEAANLFVKLNSGINKGKIIEAPVSTINNFNTYKIGDEVQVYKSTENATQETTYETADYYHQTRIFWIFVIFAVLALIVARTKGMTAIFSVVISLALFYLVFLKMVGIGYSPVLACLVLTLIVTVLTIPLIHGFNKKSLSAIIAIFTGYVLSIYISYMFKDFGYLGNSPGEEFRTLGTMFPDISLSDILIASLFMGAIGALIDTAISISSAIFEAIEDHTAKTFKQVFKTGMEVGKDILGSMINTLLFAYLASALPFLTLIYLGQDASLSELINLDFISLELTRTFIGAISLVAIIPVTSSISAYFMTKKAN